MGFQVQEVEAAARSVGISIRVVIGGGERDFETVFARRAKAVVGSHDASRRRRRRKFFGQRCVIFASVWRSRSHVDNRRDLWMHAGVCDDHPGKRMPG
jgi:hypothetical protein